MARRGRKPAPPGLKILKGERLEAAPKADSGLPEPPTYVACEALAEWHRLTGLMGLAKEDAPLLGVYCAAFARWRKATQELESSPLVLYLDNGAIKGNPAAAIAKAAEDTMARAIAEFERKATLRRSGEAPKDDLGEFLARKA